MKYVEIKEHFIVVKAFEARWRKSAGKRIVSVEILDGRYSGQKCKGLNRAHGVLVSSKYFDIRIMQSSRGNS